MDDKIKALVDEIRGVYDLQYGAEIQRLQREKKEFIKTIQRLKNENEELRNALTFMRAKVDDPIYTVRMLQGIADAALYSSVLNRSKYHFDAKEV